MTPERQKWWDSLPAEEKRVREDIDEFKRMIKHNKKHLIPYVAFAKYCIRYSKKAIKAMRKQIGLCPIDRASRNDPTGSCPTCNDLVIRREHDCCAGCGQKLRWNDD